MKTTNDEKLFEQNVAILERFDKYCKKKITEVEYKFATENGKWIFFDYVKSRFVMLVEIGFLTTKFITENKNILDWHQIYANLEYCDNGFILIDGENEAEISGNCTAVAVGRAEITADRLSTVYAYDEAFVDGYEFATIILKSIYALCDNEGLTIVIDEAAKLFDMNQLLDTAQAADFLGITKSRFLTDTISGNIPPIVRNNKTLFTKKDLIEYAKKIGLRNFIDK